MSNIFNEFYRGDLSPRDKRMVKGSEMARAMKELSDAEEVLGRTIPPELRPVLKRMADAQITVNGITAEAYFIDGFKTGARFMLAVHDDADGDLVRTPAYGNAPVRPYGMKRSIIPRKHRVRGMKRTGTIRKSHPRT